MDNKKTLMFFGGQGQQAQQGQQDQRDQQAPAAAPTVHGAPQVGQSFQPGRVSGQPPASSHHVAAGAVGSPQPANFAHAPGGAPAQQAFHNPNPANQSRRDGRPGSAGAAGGPGWQGNAGGQPGSSGFGHGNHFGGSPNPLANMTRGKIIASVAAAIVIAVVGVVGVIVKNKIGGGKAGKHTISYSRLGIDKNKANVDEVIDSLGGYAAKWKKDASWLAVNFHHVNPDGSVDLTKGSAVVKFVSASRVRSKSKRLRKDSIKEYKFGPSGARSNKIIGARKPWENFEAFPEPQCKVSNVVATLAERGFTSGTVRISFNPGSNLGWNWKVHSKNDELDGYYNMDDCSYSKKPR